MTSDESGRFTDREVALALRKASELEEEEGAGSGGGLTVGELEQIADEVGISPALVRRAAAGTIGQFDPSSGTVGLCVGIAGMSSAHKNRSPRERKTRHARAF